MDVPAAASMGQVGYILVAFQSRNAHHREHWRAQLSPSWY